MLLNLFIGWQASRKVHNTQDFMLAGRRLPFYMSTAVVFATWFGSETLLGASAEFAQHGLLGVIEDPFGAALCLVLVGVFFARRLYRMNLLTMGDFYRIRFGRRVEALAAVCMVLSYFGWIAAQMVALGILMQQVFEIDAAVGMVLASAVVVGYTYLGGMWSISVTDFIQTCLILLGLVVICAVLIWKYPLGELLEAQPQGFFRMVPAEERSATGWLNYLALWITIGLGSIPQQDVFQRVMASKSERVAVFSSVAAGAMYLSVAFMPLLIGLYAAKLHPDLLAEDPQMLVPGLVARSGELWLQVLFFGALVSAIISTSSGAMLAPAAILSENLLRPQLHRLSDRQLLRLSRLSVLLVAAVSLGMALSSNNIYELVGESSALSLVSLLVPLVAGMFWKKATPAGAMLSITAGMLVWLLAVWLETELNPMLWGLAASVLGQLTGALIPYKVQQPLAKELQEAAE
nr:sodium:solute symporter family protein [Cesiribacter sp. SM1]